MLGHIDPLRELGKKGHGYHALSPHDHVAYSILGRGGLSPGLGLLGLGGRGDGLVNSVLIPYQSADPMNTDITNISIFGMRSPPSVNPRTICEKNPAIVSIITWPACRLK